MNKQFAVVMVAATDDQAATMAVESVEDGVTYYPENMFATAEAAAEAAARWNEGGKFLPERQK